jgi:hypothetical protein
MSTPNQPSLVAEIDPIQWHHRPDNQNQLVTTRAWSNHPAFDADQPDPFSMLIFPGLGEREGTTKSVLEHCAKLGVPAVAPLFNIEQVRATKKDATTFITDFAPQVTSGLQEQGHVPGKSRTTGHSMGGGLLGSALVEAPELFGDVGFEEPAGHNNTYLRRKYPNDTLRELVFLKRFGQVVSYPFYEAPLRAKMTAAKELGYQMMRDTVVTAPPGRRLWNKFAAASSLDPIPGVVSHAANGNKVAYVLGDKDPLIRPAEVRASLDAGLQELDAEDREVAESNLNIITTDNRHSHMAFPDGQEHLEIVVDEIYPKAYKLESAA